MRNKSSSWKVSLLSTLLAAPQRKNVKLASIGSVLESCSPWHDPFTASSGVKRIFLCSHMSPISRRISERRDEKNMAEYHLSQSPLRSSQACYSKDNASKTHTWVWDSQVK